MSSWEDPDNHVVSGRDYEDIKAENKRMETLLRGQRDLQRARAEKAEARAIDNQNRALAAEAALEFAQAANRLVAAKASRAWAELRDALDAL